MIPLIKVVSLFFRVFSKPLINYTKMYHATNHIKSNRLRAFFIVMGNKYHRFQNWINKRYLKVNSQFSTKPLNDSLALEKGIQFFYQIIFYAIVIGFPVYQLYIASVQSKQKSSHLNERLKNIDEKSMEIKDKIQKLIEQKKINEKLEQNISKYNFKALSQAFFKKDSSNLLFQNTIKLKYGSKWSKQFKLCISS